MTQHADRDDQASDSKQRHFTGGDLGATSGNASAPVLAERASSDIPVHAPPSVLLMLQRSAGNAAVAATLARRIGKGAQESQRRDAAPFNNDGAALQRSVPATAISPAAVQRDGTATPPRVTSWTTKITKGGLGAGQPRDLASEPEKIFVGDTVKISAAFPRLTPDQKNAIRLDGAGDGAPSTLVGPRWEGNNATWDLTPNKVGALNGKFHITSTLTPGADLILGEHTESFQVVTDLLDFIMAIQSAQSTIVGKFASATEKLNLAATAFRQAQADQKAALDDVGAKEKMVDDLLWGALFAGAGGAIGGAIAGGVLKPIFEEWRGKGPSAEGFTDAAKDTIKFTVRSLDRLRGAGATKPSTAGDSTSPSDPTAKPAGDRTASGMNPLDFLTTSAAKIEGDKGAIQAKLTALIEAARQARATNSKADFDEDPMAIATKEGDVDTVTKALMTEKKDYLRGLWKTWLGAYAYEVGYTYSFTAGGDVTAEQAHPKSAISDKLHGAIMKAAKECGEDGDEWIRTFSEPSRLKAQQDADVFNKARGGS